MTVSYEARREIENALVARLRGTIEALQGLGFVVDIWGSKVVIYDEKNGRHWKQAWPIPGADSPLGVEEEP